MGNTEWDDEEELIRVLVKCRRYKRVDSVLCVLLGFCSSSVHFRVFSSLGVAVLPMRVVCPCFGS
jgi:hypothetical protein